MNQTSFQPPLTAPRHAYQSIQYLRAIAALMVLAYHVGQNVGLLDDGPVRPHWLAAGVDIFFVISGFVMVVSTEARPITAGRFLQLRMVRIVPLYWLCTLLFPLILLVRGQALPGWDEILKSLFFIFYTNPRSGDASPIVNVGWTLNYEMVFYLVFAALIAVPVRRRIAIMAVLFALICCARPFVPEDNGFLFRMTSPHPLEFVAGMAIGAGRVLLHRLPGWLGLAVMALALAGLATIDSPFSRVIHFAPFSALIVLGAAMSEPVWLRRPLGWMGRLGDASYSLYLTHALVLAAVEPLAVPPPLRLVVAAGIALLCVATAFLFFFGFERPFSRLAKRRLEAHARRA